jgi:HK97 family phage portal protein
MAAHPWVRAAVQAIVDDLSGVPLIAMRDGVKLDSHPVLNLLNKPNSQCSGTRLRRQLVCDWSLARNAYLRVVRDGNGDPVTVSRRHPSHVKANVNPATGMITSWTIQGQQELPPEDVLHIADVSWDDSIDGVYGESVIRTIDVGISTDIDARKQAGRAARRGRFEFLLRPREAHGTIGRTGAERIKESFEQASQSGDGLWVLGKPAEVTQLSVSMRDLEFAKLHEMTRDEVIALFGVPPVRIGLPGANYGTARQQMRTYWEHLGHIARLFDDELSRLTTDGAVIRHDLTSVEALQVSRTERQMRASVWITAFGVPPAEAARYEGFMDAPVPEGEPEDMRAPRRPPSEVVEPQEASQGADGVLQRWACLYQAAALGDGVPDESETFLRLELAPHLGAGGASRVAGLVHGAVRQYLSRAEGDDVFKVSQLRCFSPIVLTHAREAA